MTNAELIQKIRAEIERRIALYSSLSEDTVNPNRIDEDRQLLSFLSTLEEEKPMNQEGLEEEIKRYGKEEMPVVLESDLNDIARHFAEWGKEHAKIDVTDFCKPIDPGIAQCIADHSWEMLGEDEKPVPNDLEEAAKKYAEGIVQREDALMCKQAFIAGAKWQKNQMLKEARNHFVYNILSGNDMKKMIELYNDEVSCKPGDVVRAIIVKED